MTSTVLRRARTVLVAFFSICVYPDARPALCSRMHSNLESGSFNRPGLVLPFPHRPAKPRLSRNQVAPVSSLLKAQRGLARGRSWEDLAWIGLMLSALGLLIASFRI